MKKVILFDLDGTLTDSAPGITRCVQYSLASFGIEENDYDALRRFVGPPLQGSFSNFYGFSDEQAAKAVAKYRERYTTLGMYELSVYPGVENMLAALKSAGFTLAVATSKPEIFARKILEGANLARYFDEICGSFLDGRRTDKAEVIAETLCRLGVEPSPAVWMVGDRLHDVEGAHRCGISCAGVRFGYAEEGELESAGADMICADAEELREALEKLF